MLRYERQIKPGLVAFYDIRPRNGLGLFLQPKSPHGAVRNPVSDHVKSGLLWMGNVRVTWFSNFGKLGLESPVQMDNHAKQ